jgi:hypothetical protein
VKDLKFLLNKTNKINFKKEKKKERGVEVRASCLLGRCSAA